MDIMILGIIIVILSVVNFWFQNWLEEQEKLKKSKCSKCKTEFETEDKFCVSCGNERKVVK